ncbi:polymorphic toxin-type HINT domain-containing protein [Paenibacillus sp. SC116]|uniref:polymorphic toxin-type HINT domain-containing protein n=1 Tax=Paenibacillus sp. SC116 TaxID=2968986 RepID=UPI0035C6AF46
MPWTKFVQGIFIIMTTEGEKPIEDIQVGDMVLAKSDETGEVAYKEVVGLFQKQADEIYKVHIGDEVIEATAEHPFWLNGKGWTEVKDLNVGDLLVTSDGSKLEIDRIKKESREATVYNFEVADFQSYFVSNLGVWVHNCAVNGVTRLLNNMPEFTGSNREKLLSAVQSVDLRGFINELYRPGAKVGDGGTATIPTKEFYAGSSKHLLKAQERLDNLNNLVKSGKLSLNDLDILDALRDDLGAAIRLFNYRSRCL